MEQLIDFMKEFKINDTKLFEVYKRFCGEVQKGLVKATQPQSDIKCFITYVQDLPTGKETGRYLALDLGGTNFRVLLVTLKGSGDANLESKIYALSKEVITGPGELLFDHIADCLANFVHEKQLSGVLLPLGFTFSFPCVQVGLSKAILQRWTKGFSSPGVVGEDVGRLLKEAINRRDDIQIDVVAILNDTTGTLMSCAHRNVDCRVGVIIGTGCNACYVERVQCAEMLEKELKKKKHIVINTEWGAFGESGALEFVRTDFDREVDRVSINAGNQLFEKLISGMYLGDLVRLVLLKAMNENLIFMDLSNKSSVAEILSNNIGCFETRYISEIESDAKNDYTNAKQIIKDVFDIDDASSEDCEKLRYICACISSRAAQLVSVGLSGLINKINEPKAIVGVDGSVYRLHPKFDEIMRETMRKLINPKLSFDIMLSEDGSGRGAALVAAVAASR